MPLIGLILGIIALRQINKSGERGKGFAIAAIVIGLLSFVVVFFLFVPMLAYFGVLDPANLLPERCQFPAGMDCIDRAAITSDTITIALRNNIGFAISVDDVESSCTGALIAPRTGEFQELPMEVENNAAYRIRLTGCSNGRSGSEVTEEIGVIYENPDTGLTNTAQGEVRGRVV